MLDLDEYLKMPQNSVFKEKLINYKLFYEIKLASAKVQNDIRIYTPEIDRDGCDIILDDGDSIFPMQLKVMNKSSSTKSWRIQKNLLRPSCVNCVLLGFEESPQGEGSQGGFILIRIDVGADEIKEFEYFYTDIFILKALELGLLEAKKKDSKSKDISIIINDLLCRDRKDKIELSNNELVKVKSVEHILALADISSKYHNQWQITFKNFLKSRDIMQKNEVKNLLKSLIDDSGAVRVKIEK